MQSAQILLSMEMIKFWGCVADTHLYLCRRLPELVMLPKLLMLSRLLMLDRLPALEALLMLDTLSLLLLRRRPSLRR